ncbi:hydrogenase nickel incorporation protein HypB [candidate division KSB1 bacterium]
MMKVITIEREVLKKNDEIAEENRSLFDEAGLFVINLLSSPGSGKTSVLERTLEKLKNELKIAVIEGDIQTSNDAERIAKIGIPAVQIVTKGSCHLDAKMVQNALNNFDLNNLDILFIENVGNLVCPAGFYLGEDLKVVLMSTPEGDDKPLKYPTAFRKSTVLIVNKVDLLPHLDFNINMAIENSLNINPDLKVFKTSCKTLEGIDDWCQWLKELKKK